MQHEILFSETQKFEQWGLCVFLIGAHSIFVFALIQRFVLKKSFGNNPTENVSLEYFNNRIGIIDKKKLLIGIYDAEKLKAELQCRSIH